MTGELQIRMKTIARINLFFFLLLGLTACIIPVYVPSAIPTPVFRGPNEMHVAIYAANPNSNGMDGLNYNLSYSLKHNLAIITAGSLFPKSPEEEYHKI